MEGRKLVGSIFCKWSWDGEGMIVKGSYWYKSLFNSDNYIY